MATKIRAFLAMTIPQKVQQKVGALVRELEQKAPEMHWIPQDKLHVTLYFFGQVEERLLIDEIVPLLEKKLKSEPPLDLNCNGLGVFPNWKYPKVVWAGITGSTDQLLLLHAHLTEVLQPFGFKKDKRLFRPHLTIGRSDKILKDAQVVRRVEQLGPIEFGAIPVKNLTLFRSELTKEGPIYTPLKVLPLG